jgi:thymidylate synthase
MDELRFEPLYRENALHLFNPAGDVGIICLWSRASDAIGRLREISPGLLDPAHSRIAVLANLYGDGMYDMFCNLLYNPQVRHLVAIGNEMKQPTCAEIEAFLRDGLEDVTMLGRAMKRIRGTSRYLPDVDGFDEHQLRSTLSFRYLGPLNADPVQGLPAYLGVLPRTPAEALPARVRVDLAQFDAEDYEYRPSDVGAHHVERRSPLDCWEELVVRGMRFGQPVTLSNGPRIELLNTKAVIREPVEDSPESVAEYGIDFATLMAYQQEIMDPKFQEDISYTYGNRLLDHFQQGTTRNSLDSAVRVLTAGPESRRAYVTLWDMTIDLTDPDSARPCLTTLYFRRNQDRLVMTATYRAHNLLSAWLKNVYGLIEVQRHVAQRLDLPAGPLTVISHSLTIDPKSRWYETAKDIVARWPGDNDQDRAAGKHLLRDDPHGYFVVTIDERSDKIIAEHRTSGLLIKRYEARKAATLAHRIMQDMAVSLPSHALWLGRELAEKEHQLKVARARERRPAATDEAAPS